MDRVDIIDMINKDPGTRIICEWCGNLIIGKRKRFCDLKNCKNPYQANNQTRSARKKKNDKLKEYEFTEEHRKHLRENHADFTGENNPRYGLTWDNYEYDPLKPTKYYRKLALSIYPYECFLCNKSEGVLIVHHIDGNHTNDDLSNLSILCPSCHGKLHYTPDEIGRYDHTEPTNLELTKLVLISKLLRDIILIRGNCNE